MRNLSVKQLIFANVTIRFLLFWMIVFFIFRFIFIIVNYSLLGGSFADKSFAFVFATRLDLSMSAYLTAIPVLFWFIYTLFKKQLLIKIAHVLNTLFIVLVTFICLMNIGNYANWGTVINKRILLYFKNPAEISHFMSTAQMIMAPIAIAVIAYLMHWFCKYFIIKKIEKINRFSVWRLIDFPVLFILIRGGWQLVPIGESAAYYSSVNANNHAAVNPVFYFLHSAGDYFSVTEKFKFYDIKKRDSIFSELMNEKDSTIQLSNVKNPNLVIIVLESWTADILETISGEKGIAPFTDSLIKKSLFFSQCYGSGYRTDQGLVSILAGYPAQPDNSIIAYPSKTENLPSLCKVLRNNKFATSFFYGGDLEFANMKSFILQQGFEKLNDKSNYNSNDYNSKWGAHDDKVLQSQLKYLKNLKKSFFSVLLTLSTHEPFEIPIKHKFPHNNENNKFKNAAFFTDVCLRNYFNEAKKQDWYKNTIFLLVADHGHHLPLNRNMDSPESKRITCLITGGALTQNLRGAKWNKKVAQHDLIRLLSDVYGVNKKRYRFSKNPLVCIHPFATFCNENVSAFLTDSTFSNYLIPQNAYEGSQKLKPFANAWLQTVYADFIAK